MPEQPPPQSSDAAFMELVVRYLDNQLSDADLQSLRKQLAASSEARTLFVQFANLHGLLAERAGKSRVHHAAASTAPQPLDTLAALAASTSRKASARLQPQHLHGAAPQSGTQRHFWQSPAWRIAAVFFFIASAVMAMTSPTWLSWWRRAPVATLVDAVDAQWDNVRGYDVGEHLPREPLFLKSGYARVRLESGVSLVIQGPAHFSIDSTTQARLDQGKITADVPHTASGFSVKIPAGVVTDLGTAFGVTAFANGEATVQVLKGTVQAKLVSDDGKQRDVTVLEEDHAAAFNPMAEKLSSISAVADAYVTDIHHIPPTLTPREEVALSLHNTGQDLKEGDADPAWQITARSDDPSWAARPAVVSTVAGGGFANDWARSQWLSTAVDAPKLPNFLRLTFTTTVDLSGFDPATVKLHLRIWVDDDLGELRLNGKPMGPAFMSHGDFKTPHDFTLDHGFVPGINRLDFVAVDDLPSADVPSPMELRVEMDGTAAKIGEGVR
jgi:hypothetical protein